MNEAITIIQEREQQESFEIFSRPEEEAAKSVALEMLDEPDPHVKLKAAALILSTILGQKTLKLKAKQQTGSPQTILFLNHRLKAAKAAIQLNDDTRATKVLDV